MAMNINLFIKYRSFKEGFYNLTFSVSAGCLCDSTEFDADFLSAISFLCQILDVCVVFFSVIDLDKNILD